MNYGIKQSKTRRPLILTHTVRCSRDREWSSPGMTMRLLYTLANSFTKYFPSLYSALKRS
jgi:hypothetical protein